MIADCLLLAAAPPTYDYFIRLTVAFALGALIGLERERHSQVGIRTSGLVSLGAAVFVLLSFYLPMETSGGDVSGRLAAAVVQGVGFLGAGVIFKQQNEVRGLTTAAAVWCAAGVGMLAGNGLLREAAITAGLIMVATLLLRPVSHYVEQRFSKEQAKEKDSGV